MSGYLPALTTVLVAGGTAAAIALLWDADNLLSRLVGFDVSFVTLPATLCGALLTLGRLALWLSKTEFAAHAAVRRSDKPAASATRLAEVLAAVYRVLTDLSWATLVLGLLSSVTEWPGLKGSQEAAPDLVAPAHYLGGLESFVVWGALLLAPFIAVRAVATFRPDIGVIAGWPWVEVAVFGVAYALLSADGALSAAFGLAGNWPLLGFGLTLALAYAASATGRALAIKSQGRARGLRWLRGIGEAAWPLALWFAVVALASSAERASTDPQFAGPGSVDVSFLEVLHSLTFVETLALLIPFALINTVRALWPAAAHSIGAPIWPLALMALTHLLFSSSGMIPTAFAVDFPWMYRALVGAITLGYAASVLRNVASIDVQRWYLKLVLRVLSAAARAAALAAVVLAALTYLPQAVALLLEQPAPRALWEGILPLVAGLYEVRFAIAGSTFTIAAVFLLVRAMNGQISGRVEALMSAISYAVAGYLIWMIAADLAEYGHGFPFVGAVAAAGMFSLALSRVASSAASSSNPAVADIAGWISASWARAFMLGAAAMFYALLLRPVVYELVGLAALYEYLAVLALLLILLISVVNRLRGVAAPADTAAGGWADWQHHEQTLEHKADPRATLPNATRQRYLEDGDWLPLWVYLLALLYRSAASLDAMAAVCGLLRRGAVTPLAWTTLSRSRKKVARSAALQHALDTAGRALANSTAQLERLSEEDVRRLGASYIDTGRDIELLAVALIVAHCQRGDRPEHAVDRWFFLLDTSNSVLERLSPKWGRLPGRPRTAAQRIVLVNEAVSSLFHDPLQPGPSPARRRLAANVAQSRT